MKNKGIVSKSNHLIESSYVLNRLEQYFVLYLISKLDSINQKKLPEYTMSESEIVKILNYDGVRRIARSSDIFKMMNNLNRNPIKWDNEIERGQAVWISSLVYTKKSKEYTFRFDPRISDLLLELKSYFTSYHLDTIKTLKFKHSIRIYELLQKNHKLGGFAITLERLRFLLGLEGKYERYSELKRNVLDEAYHEINRNSDLRFTYRIHRKEGRRVVALKFLIES